MSTLIPHGEFNVQNAKDTTPSLGPTGEPQSQKQASSSQLRRTTCNLCRERKVRCDREKPHCRRCRRAGQTCVYASDKTSDKEIKSALSLLHSRLLQAERRLQEQDTQYTAQSMKTNSGLSPSYMPQNSLFAGEMLPQGFETDYSNVAFGEFDLSNYHRPLSMMDVANSSGTDGTPSDLDLNIANLKDSSPEHSSNPPFEQPPRVTGLEQQYQTYFDIVQKHMMLIDQQEFLQSVVPMDTHQCIALKYATALSGSSACGDSAMAGESYIAARYHLERAEILADNSSFLNIETVQALLLVARFEFIYISVPKGLLTIARAVQLLSLQGYDMLDRISAESQRDGSQVMPPNPHSPGYIQVIRRTFWIAFAMHCNAVASFPCCIPVKDAPLIGTALPVSNLSMDSDHDHYIYLSEGIMNARTREYSVLSLFIFTMKLVVDGDRHRQSTKKYVQDNASEYNFCVVHEKIGAEITSLSESLSEHEFLNGTDEKLRVLTCIIVLGIRIDWLKTAVIGSQKAVFLGPVAKEYRTSCVAVTNTMCELLLQANVNDVKEIPVYKEMSLFIMRPLALAAEFQLDILQNPQETSYHTFSSAREIQQNLELLSNFMMVCKPATGIYDATIRACVAYLEKVKFYRSSIRGC